MPNDPARVETITGRGRRRRCGAEQKLALVEETTQPGVTVPAVARQHGVSPSLLFGWGRLMPEGGQVAVRADEGVVAASRARELGTAGARAGAAARTQGHGSRAAQGSPGRGAGGKPAWQLLPPPPGRFPVKVAADTLGVARSNLAEQLAGRTKRRNRCHRRGDGELLAAIRQLTDARPTCGYRRVTALLSRARRASGAEPVNHERAFRLMAQGKLPLQPNAGARPVRAHEGRVVAPASNQRWSSDACEVACWDGEVVRVALAIDTCDREVVAWQAATTGVSGERVRDLTRACAAARFGTCRAPRVPCSG